jgi:phosphohistidine phosphatase
MSVYLVQHGKSLPKEEDPEKGLSEKGIKDVKRIAKVGKESGISVSCIKHSGKKRARQTAEIFSSALNPEGGVQEVSGLNPVDDVRTFSSNLRSKENVMYVGHLPFMERLSSYLICGDEDNPVFKFQNGGIVCIDKDEDSGKWVIQWTFMPDIK